MKKKCLPCVVHRSDGHNVYIHVTFGGRGEDDYTITTGVDMREAFMKIVKRDYVNSRFTNEGDLAVDLQEYFDRRWMDMAGETISYADVL